MDRFQNILCVAEATVDQGSAVARTGVSGFIIGNTAEAILDQLACSVLAIKPPGLQHRSGSMNSRSKSAKAGLTLDLSRRMEEVIRQQLSPQR